MELAQKAALDALAKTLDSVSKDLPTYATFKIPCRLHEAEVATEQFKQRLAAAFPEVPSERFVAIGWRAPTIGDGVLTLSTRMPLEVAEQLQRMKTIAGLAQGPARS